MKEKYDERQEKLLFKPNRYPTATTFAKIEEWNKINKIK